MASNYQGFDVLARDASGVLTPIAGATVAIYDVTAAADAAESPLTADGDGHIPDGTLSAVAPGTRIRFRIDNLNGRCDFTTQITS